MGKAIQTLDQMLDMIFKYGKHKPKNKKKIKADFFKVTKKGQKNALPQLQK